MNSSAHTEICFGVRGDRLRSLNAQRIDREHNEMLNESISNNTKKITGDCQRCDTNTSADQGVLARYCITKTSVTRTIEIIGELVNKRQEIKRKLIYDWQQERNNF